MKARFARLWPLHVAILGFGALLIPLISLTFDGPGVANKWLLLLTNLTLTHSIIPLYGYTFSWNAVSWSISTELFFYLLFPLLLSNIHRTWHWKLALSVVPLLVIGFIVQWFQISDSGGLFDIRSSALLYPSPLGRLFEFCLGMAAYVGWQTFSRLQLSRLTATIIEVVILAAAIYWLWKGFWIAMGSLPAWPVLSTWFSVGGSSWIFALVIIVLASGRGLIGQALSFRFFVWLGEISFALYLVHQIMFKIINIHFGSFKADWFFKSEFFVFGMLLLASAIGYHLIEKPCRDFINGKTRLWGRRLSSSTAHVSKPAS